MNIQRAKMLTGDLYDANDPDLTRERYHARRLLCELNRAAMDDEIVRDRILHQLFAEMGTDVWIEPPFYCDYGKNIYLGSKVFINFNCVILDPAAVHLGDSVLLGPNVQLYTAGHPLDAAQRSEGLEYAREIHVGEDVWIGGGSLLLPGTRVGPRTVIGAGSVVFGEVPADVLVVGNPWRIVRSLA